MKIATWNINSIRIRMPLLTAWLEKAKPDVLLLQEIKSQNDQFPEMELKSLGYEHIACVGQKSYNGVALISRRPITNVMTALPGDETDEQARFVQAEVNGIQIGGLYLPNGNPVDSEKYDYKLSWMDRLITHAKSMLAAETPFVLGGDFNVIPAAEDAYNAAEWENDALYKLTTRKKFRELLYLGLSEAFRLKHPTDRAFSFWDYQGGAWQRDNGIRIDHFLLCPQMADRLEMCEIDKEPRGQEKPSDHVPVVITV